MTNRPPRIPTLTMGRVRKWALNVQSARKPMFWSQMFDRALGHRLFSPKYRFRPTSVPRPGVFLSVLGSPVATPIRFLRCGHSPKNGKGHTVQQTRDANGTITLMSRNHQKIQTKMMMMFGFPTGLPKMPADKKTKNRKRFERMTAN